MPHLWIPNRVDVVHAFVMDEIDRKLRALRALFPKLPEGVERAVVERMIWRREAQLYARPPEGLSPLQRVAAADEKLAALADEPPSPRGAIFSEAVEARRDEDMAELKATLAPRKPPA